MDQLNNFLLDTLFNEMSSDFTETPPVDKIKNGTNFGLSIIYKPLKYQSFGIYGSYQFGKLIRQGELLIYNTPFVAEKSGIFGKFTYETQAITCGFVSQTFLNELFFDNSSQFWQQAELFIETKAGLAFSNFRKKSLINWIEEDEKMAKENLSYSHSSLGFHGIISINFEYAMTKNPLVTNLGIKAGYQFLKTKNIKNDAGDVITYRIDNGVLNQVRLNLDFSGIFAGVYFTIGK